MFNLTKKSKIRNSKHGEIARWVGNEYLQQVELNPNDPESETFNRIFEKRFPSHIEYNSISDIEGLLLGINKSDVNCLLDVVTAIIKYELGYEGLTDQKQMKLLYEVIIGELRYLGVPSEKIIPGLR